MNCAICGHDELVPGSVTMVLERGDLTMVLKRVPAMICESCSEEYLDETSAAEALAKGEAAVRDGVQVEIRQFEPA